MFSDISQVYAVLLVDYLLSVAMPEWYLTISYLVLAIYASQTFKSTGIFSIITVTGLVPKLVAVVAMLGIKLFWIVSATKGGNSLIFLNGFLIGISMGYIESLGSMAKTAIQFAKLSFEKKPTPGPTPIPGAMRARAPPKSAPTTEIDPRELDEIIGANTASEDSK